MFPSETSQGGPSLPHSSRHCGLLNPHQNSHFSSAYSILAFLAHSPRLLFPLKIISKGLPQQQSYLAVPIFWICYFSHYWILGKKQLKEWGVCFGLRFGRLRWLWRGRELVDCITVMKQTDGAGVQLALSILLSPGKQPMRCCCLYSGSAFPT